MTANEMKFSWLLKFDKLFELAAPVYNDSQISSFLTNGQLRIFKKHYRPLGNKYKEGFEKTEIRRRDLEQFIKSGDVAGDLTNITLSSNQDGIHPNGYFYDMPDDFYMALEESVTLSGDTDETTVKPVTHDEYRANIKNPYKKPYSDLVWRMDFSRVDHGEDGGDSKTGQTAKRVELITDGTAITDYRVRYLITPPDIVCDETTAANQRHCILDDTLHEEIVDEAVQIARAAIEDGYQVSSIESIDSE